MKKNKKIMGSNVNVLFFMMIGLFSFNTAHAYYAKSIIDEHYKGTLTYKSGNVSTTITYLDKSDGLFKPVINTSEKLHTLDSQLYQALGPVVSGMVQELGVSLKGYSVVMPGSIVVKLIPRSNGAVDVKVGGFSVRVHVDVSKSWYVKGDVDITTGTVWFAGSYDVYSGKISNIRPESFTTNIKVDIDSIFDLLPGFNAIFTNKFEDKVEQNLKSMINSQLGGALSGQTYTVMGLNKAIPSGKYVFNGLDLGVLLKDELANMAYGQSLTVTFSEQHYRWNSGLKNEIFVQDKVLINLSNKIKLEILQIPVFSPVRWVPYCDPRRGCEGEP